MLFTIYENSTIYLLINKFQLFLGNNNMSFGQRTANELLNTSRYVQGQEKTRKNYLLKTTSL